MTELAFCIHPSLSSQREQLVLELKEVTLDGSFPQFESGAPPMTESRVRSLAKEAEKPLLRALARCVTLDKTWQHVAVPVDLTEEILQHLAGTGKVFYGQKSLVLNLFSQCAVHYGAELKSGRIEVNGSIEWGKEQVLLEDFDLLIPGEHPYALKGISLKRLADVHWKWIRRVHQGSWIITDPVEVERFQRDFEEDELPRAPKVTFSGRQEARPDPVPLLQLSDRQGAFARLMMGYDGEWVPFQSPAPRAGKWTRDGEAEKYWESDLLETDFRRQQDRESDYHCPLDKVSKSLSFLLELGWQVKDKEGRVVQRPGQWDYQVVSGGNALMLRGKLAYEEHEVSLKDVVGAFNRRDSFVQLAGGGVGLLPERSSCSEVLTAADAGELVSAGIKVRREQAGLLLGMPEDSVRWDAGSQGLMERLQDFDGLALLEPGAEFLGDLRGYQQAGLNWLGFLQNYGFHGLLADDMGLGKTVQILALLSTMSPESRVLVILPTSLLFNWEAELSRFLPHWPVTRYHGSQRDSMDVEGVVLTSYATLRQDLLAAQQVDWDLLILDEAQAIKNPRTQTARAVCSLNAKLRIAVTGTPVENRLEELWSHFHFLMPGLLGDLDRFSAQAQAAESDSRHLTAIRKQIAPFILRRSKKEVAPDLPEKIEQVLWVEMKDEQRRVYEDYLAKVKRGILRKVSLDGVGAHRMEVLESILRLRQLCCHPLLLSEDVASAKLEVLMRDLETVIEEGGKALVYSQFTQMLALVKKEISARGWEYAYLDGQTRDRQGEVQRFQENPDVPIFLISLKAGGVGLNLSEADYVFLFDPWWNDAVEQQAIDRAHRIGRRDVVVAKRLVVRESIEEKMMSLKSKKQSLAQGILDQGEAALSLSAEDLEFLLQS